MEEKVDVMETPSNTATEATIAPSLEEVQEGQSPETPQRKPSVFIKYLPAFVVGGFALIVVGVVVAILLQLL